ncbi:TatD family deoxyribonuclease [Patescibacteria group bacterium]|nr:MAG: TatD family deoxyribonuclease [Patescibacteria group bacterium]
MELVDTHCHIHESGLHTASDDHTRQKWALAGNPTPTSLVAAAKKAGVTRMICVGCTRADSQLAIQLASSQTGCWASIGIHPHEAQMHNTASEKAQFVALATEFKVVSVGECGLDYFYNHSPKSDQLAMLEFQLQLAMDRELPVIFHVRDAYDDFWPVFRNFPGLSGVLHSFTDSMVHMERAVSEGLYIGVNGIATFTKDDAQQTMFKAIPLSKLLLETDAPYLTPTPVRGTINEPKNVTYITQFLAELRGEPPEEIATATTMNAVKLFGLM